MTTEAPERGGAAAVPDEALNLAVLTADDRGIATPTEPEPTVGDRGPGAPPEPVAAVNPVPTAAAAFLASAAAGWVMGGIFTGIGARLVAVLGAAIGAGSVALGRRSRWGQLLALPVAMVVGAILVVPDATGGTANLPGLVLEALRSGGLSSPPVPFDPGWRFLLVVVTALLGVSSASMAVAFNRPRLAVGLAVPLIAGGMMIQPPGRETSTALVALVLAIAGLGVSFGAQLSREGVTGAKFEARRLLRAGAVIVAIVIGLGALSQVGALFPAPTDNSVVPPKRPENPPPQKDRVIFTVKAPQQLPWRLGVLDVYGVKERAWLTPPYDPKRLQQIPSSGALPTTSKDSVALTDAQPHITVTFTIVDEQGRVIPDIANPVGLHGTSAKWDPRTQSLQLDGRVRAGTHYTVEAEPPTPAALLNAADRPSAAMSAYLVAPPMPQIVRELLDAAPKVDAQGRGSYERLQYVRTTFYSKITAAGPGKPVDVSADRVAEMLNGKPASPYEITAAEALLARWAGIPARIGYGYYSADDPASIKNGVASIRPGHGRTWLEAYFEGHGWTPIVGTPPKAKDSTDTAKKNHDPRIKPSTDIALLVYVPLQASTFTLLYTVVLFWLLRLLPVVLGLLLLLVAYPGLLKAARTFLRQRWGAGLGPRARIGVAYAGLRDSANDLGIGHPTLTPIQFLDTLAADKEHRELAWLVTRTIWGDLVRDTRATDADRAEDLARSVRRRLLRAQPPIMRGLGFVSRASLRDPYNDEVPNLWWELALGRRVRRVTRAISGVVRAVGRALRRLRPRRPGRLIGRPAATSTMLLMLVLTLFVGGCARTLDLKAAGTRAEETSPSVPSNLAGLDVKREGSAESAFRTLYNDSLVTAGRVYSLHQGPAIQGSLQVAWFKPSLQARLGKAKEGMLTTLEGGHFNLTRIGDQRIYVKELAEQSLYVWFPTNEKYYELVVARTGFDPRQFFVSLLAFQQGRVAERLSRTADVQRETPYLGSDN
jgi:hypothetical protein